MVRNGRRAPRAVTLASVPGGGAPAAGDRFGAALASGMLVDGRPCTDLLAGAPGRGGTGEAYVLFGSTGAAVAISDTTEDSQFPGHNLWIGAPGRDVAGHAHAGAVYHYVISSSGAIFYMGVTTQGAGAEAGDRLGEVLAPTAGGVLAGVPREDAGTRRDAGALLLVRSGGGTRTAAGSHAGDRLGAATLGIAPDIPGLDEDEYDTLLTGIPAGGILTLRGGYPARHGRLAAPRDAPGYGGVFPLPS